MTVGRRAIAGRDPLFEHAQLSGSIAGGNQHAGFHALPPLFRGSILGIDRFHGSCPPSAIFVSQQTRRRAFVLRTSITASYRGLSMSPSSSQKVALVTGAARGIGLATAKRFLSDGWRVALLDIEAQLLRTSVTALGRGKDALALHCDVSDAEAVTAAIDGIARHFGRLDALVNNAGIAAFAPLLETSDEDWNRILAVNLTGPFICTKAAAPLMREHGGGAVVNITSISAVRASTLRSAYGTSKAGLAHLTKQLAVELASLGI